MKKYLKEILPALFTTIAVGFMLFICEPITIYASNTEDFWFDMRILIKNNLIYFGILTAILMVISNIVLLISRKTKKDWIYNIFILIFNVGFISTYIQGNFLAGALPTLDGSPIEWKSYTNQNIISCVMILIVLAINIGIYVKFKDKYKKIVSFTSAAIFVMLLVSLISIMTTNKQIYQLKGVYTSTNKNINKLSSRENLLVLLVDMEDSKTFDKVLKEEGKEYLLKDFTYYPDTLSAYPFTRESIPYVLTGQFYEAEVNYNDYYTDALNNSKLIENLKNRKYDVNIYEQYLNWNDAKSLEVKNIDAINSKTDTIKFFKQEAKYLMFKYLPFPAKQYSKVDTLDYESCRIENNDTEGLFKEDNEIFYNSLTDISLQKNNYFQFIHIEGGHYPWDSNKNFEYVENGTYEEKIGESITVIEKYLDRIKKSGQYDNTAIIILADHGNNGYDAVGRQNPILYIKGRNETHDKMQISDKKVSFVDLNDSIYNDLLDGKKSDEILTNIPEDRVRRFIWYKDYDQMYEQTLDGHAWETDKLKNTGNEYKR